MSKYNGQNFTNYTEKEGLSDNFVRSILEDKDGNLWFGTYEGGVSKYDGKSFTHYTEKEGLSNNQVLFILEDKSGNLWFGTWGGGVCKYDGKSFTQYTEKEGLSDNFVLTILEDKDGNLWFGTYEGGLSKYDGKSFIHYTEKEGLSHNFVMSILEDKSNNIWVTTKEGLSLLKHGAGVFSNTKNGKKSEKPTYEIISFEKQDGLKEMDFWVNSAFLDSKNRIWWGSIKCLTMLDLSKFELPKPKTRIQLNSVEIQEKFIDYRLLKEAVLSTGIDNNTLPEEFYRDLIFDSVARFYNYPLNLKLLYNFNHLTFHFSALDWEAPHKLQYQYKLEGLKEQWSKISPENKADYRNIPYGEYIFKVKAIGAARKWSDTFEYSFIIHPPWWHTWWARTVYLIVGLILIWLIIRWRTAKLKQDRKRLEVKVKERTLEIKNKNEELGQQKEEIESKNEELQQQNEEIQSINNSLSEQKGLVEERNVKLSQQKDELKENLEKIKIVNQKLSDSEKKLKELDEFKSKFFANISHEFRTPLSLIFASIDDLLHSDIVSPDHEHALNLIIKNSNRLYQLINQLLELSKLDEGKMGILLRRGNISIVLKDILSNYDSVAKRKRIKFNIHFPGESIHGYWDHNKLEIIAHNLLSNAFKFTPEYGKISFKSGQYNSKDISEINIKNISENHYLGKYLKIQIDDSGPGIPANKMDKIFERFEKVRADQKFYSEGMGIGLALTKELVYFQNGFLFVKSRKGKGSTFTVYLPIEKSGFQNAEIVADQLNINRKADFEKDTSFYQPEIPIESNGHQPVYSNTILIVEDNDDMRSYIAKNLKQKYKVELAINGNDGVQKAIEMIPDLIITDWMMPKRNGLSLCALLKEDERTSHIPIIMLTAKASVENRIEGLQTGADNYLEKPFKIDELKVRIENLIKQRQKLKEKYSKMIGYVIEDMEITNMDEQFMKNALALVEENLLNENWTIAEFSSSINMSRSQLFRKIKALTEMSISEFILTHRLEKAARLLEANFGTISEIAFKVGFNSAPYFSKCFHQKYNITPRSYLLHHKNKRINFL